MKKYKSDIVLILILLALASLVWKDIPKLVIRGDGFVYMVASTLNEFFSRKYWFTGYETSATIFGLILPKLFKTNISLYLYTSLGLMMAINTIFYILLRVLTKDRTISFFIALLFAVNYFGNFDMYSQHCYCYIFERVFGAPFLLSAFLFLHLFLEKNKKKYLFISLGFYLFGVGLARFAILFTAPYLVYPFFWQIFAKKKIQMNRVFTKGVLVGLLYLAISGFIVFLQFRYEGDMGKNKFLDYLLHPNVNQYPQKIIRQFVYWSQYQPAIINFLDSPVYRFIDIRNAERSTPFITFIYIVAALYVYIKLPRQRAILLTTLVGSAVTFYVNAWFGQYYVLSQPGANRYLYYSTFLLVIFWGLFIWIFWKRNSTFSKMMVIMVLIAYFFLNWRLISGNFNDVLQWDRSTKLIFDHMTSMRPKLGRNTLIVAPDPEVWVYESNYFTEQIGKGEVKFVSDRGPYVDWIKEASVSSKVIRLHYDKKCDCVKEETIK